MNNFIAPELTPAYPEIFLAIMTFLMLMLGVAGKKEDFRSVARFSFLTLAAALVMLIFRSKGLEAVTTFNGMFIVDPFSTFMKTLVVIGSGVSIILSIKYTERERIMRFEYLILMMLSTLGMLLMISANDLMALYVGLELQSLPLYVLAAIQRDTVRSTEAGLKYFVLGALSSGLLLYGSSLLYGFTGTTNFDAMAMSLTGQGAAVGAVVGMVLVISALAFKISAVPFHMWTPDVYEGAPTSVTAFFAIVPKIAALALITRVLMGPFAPLTGEWQQVVVLLSIASMALGAVAAVAQSNIKRLLAYSSIGHMGYALVGIAAANKAGIAAVMVYAAIYMVTSMGVFAVVLLMKRKDRMVEGIKDLAGLSRRQPMLALALSILMFSMAGIPPFAGFFGKLFVFQAAVEAKLYILAILGVLTSVVAAFYYIRLIKVMYFDEPAEEGLDAATDTRLMAVLAVVTLAVVCFIVMPSVLLEPAQAVAQTLIK